MMKSEWEELESLSKEELIIELVKWKTVCSIMYEDSDDADPLLPVVERKYTEDDDPGETTTHEWAERIAIHGAMRPVDGAFYPCDLMNYGMTAEQADEICIELYKSGRLKLPDGVEYYDIETGEYR